MWQSGESDLKTPQFQTLDNIVVIQLSKVVRNLIILFSLVLVPFALFYVYLNILQSDYYNALLLVFGTLNYLRIFFQFRRDILLWGKEKIKSLIGSPLSVGIDVVSSLILIGLNIRHSFSVDYLTVNGWLNYAIPLTSLVFIFTRIVMQIQKNKMDI